MQSALPFLPSLSTALAVLVAARCACAAATPTVTLGFEGHVRAGSHVHVRLDLENPGDADRLTFRLRETAFDRGVVSWVVPLSVPRSSRRTEFVTILPSITAAGFGSLEWSTDGKPWQALPGVVLLPEDGVAFAVAVTSRGQSLPQLRASIDAKGQGIFRVAVVRPDGAPPDAAAWDAADVILVDADAATALSLPAWRAIEGRVLLGATLVVHGAEFIAGVPDALLAGNAGEASVVGLGASGGLLPVRLVTPLADARSLEVDGEPAPWAAVARRGQGRVVTAGVNLHDVVAAEGMAQPWLALLGVKDRDDVTLLRARAPRLRRAVREQGAGEGAFDTRALAIVGLLAAGLGVGAAVGAILVVRHPERRDRAWLLIPAGCLALSLPGFLAGMAFRLVATEAPAFVLEESFPEAGRRRVTTLHGPWSEGRVPDVALAAWPAGLDASNAMAPPAGTFEVGAEPVASGFTASLGAPVAFTTERWEDAAPAFAVEEHDDGSIAVSNLSREDFDVVILRMGGLRRVMPPLRAGAVVLVEDAALPAPARRDPLTQALADALVADAVVAARSSGGRFLSARRTDRVVVEYLPRPR